MIEGNTQANVCITKDIIMTHKFGAYSKTWISSEHPRKQQIFQISLPSSCYFHLQKTLVISSSLSQFLLLFKASFQFWQAAELRLDTMWYKQESGGAIIAHKEPAGSRSQKLKVRDTVPCPAQSQLPCPRMGGRGCKPISYSFLGLGPSNQLQLHLHFCGGGKELGEIKCCWWNLLFGSQLEKYKLL